MPDDDGKCPKCGVTLTTPEDHCPNDAWEEVLDAVGQAWPEAERANLCYDESPCELIAEIIDQRDRLQAIVDKLPKTADGVPYVLGDTIYEPDGSEYTPNVASIPQFHSSPCTVHEEGYMGYDVSECYSTREAVEAAETSDE